MGVWILAAVSSFIIMSTIDFMIREKDKLNNRWESKTLFGLLFNNGGDEFLKTLPSMIAGSALIVGSLFFMAVILFLCLNGVMSNGKMAYYDHIGVWTPMIFAAIGAVAYWPAAFSRNLWRWIGRLRREAATSGTRLTRWAEKRATQLCNRMASAKWSEVRVQVRAVARETIPRLLRRKAELEDAITRTEELVRDTEDEDCDPALVERTEADQTPFRQQLARVKDEIANCRHFLIHIESDIIAANLAESGETDAYEEIAGIAGKVAEVNQLSQATGDEVDQTERRGNGQAARRRATVRQ